ncbi:MAG: hypothetical protein Q7T55_09050 [Solirubrobacteraceae bacterium]|nr:hypothetical protein [Solirubrobacteraceae bacterium]
MWPAADLRHAVSADLEQLAMREHLSVSAYCVRELTQRSRAARNAALLDTLPVLDISMEEIVAAIREDRDSR